MSNQWYYWAYFLGILGQNQYRWDIFWFSIKFKGNHTVAQKNKRLKRIITIQFDDLLLQKAGKCSIYDKIGYFLVLKQIDLIFRSKLHRNFAKWSRIFRITFEAFNQQTTYWVSLDNSESHYILYFSNSCFALKFYYILA